MPVALRLNEGLGITDGPFPAHARDAAAHCMGLEFFPPQLPTLNEGTALPCGGSDKLTFQQRVENIGCSPRSAANPTLCRQPRMHLAWRSVRLDTKHEDARSEAHWHDRGTDFFSGRSMNHGNSA